MSFTETIEQKPKTALDHLDDKLREGLIAHHRRRPVRFSNRPTEHFKTWFTKTPYLRADNGQVFRATPKPYRGKSGLRRYKQARRMNRELAMAS